MLVKILTIYPELSAEWLMRGDGEMLRGSRYAKIVDSTSTQHSANNTNEILDKQNTTSGVLNRLFDSLSEKEDILRKQAEEIGGLKERIKQLEYELKKHASVVSDSSIANAV